MNNIFTLCALHTIEAQITIPTHGYFVRNEENIRLSYRVGRKLKHVVLPTRLEVAKVLFELEYIDYYDHSTGEMYTVRHIPYSGHRGRVEWKEMRVHQPWESLELNAAQVLKICTWQEYGALPILGKLKRLVA